MTDQKSPSGHLALSGHSILLTGFGPFPGVTVNASARLVAAAVEAARAQHRYHSFFGAVLPTEWGAAPRSAVDLIARIKPSVVLHFGVAHDCIGLRLETQATNTCGIAVDASGLKPLSPSLVQAGADTIAVTLPIHQIARSLASRALPVSLSNDAGAYLCNAVLYRSLEYVHSVSMPTRVGFIHIPTKLQRPALTFDTAVAGTLEIIAACLEDHRLHRSSGQPPPLA
ncbi:MAG: pyroglutamyl-peptidase I [Hyphomicrobium sp.]|nr:pyroglutamyl-peptidase I [Hyphomicrobium sp.]